MNQKGFIIPLEDHFKKLFDDRKISFCPMITKGGVDYEEPYYKGIWQVQQLGENYFYPTSFDLNLMSSGKFSICPCFEATRTLILIPNSNGQLTERAGTPSGHRLTGYKHPVISEDFTVIWNEQTDELNHLIINPDTLIQYPELVEGIDLERKLSEEYKEKCWLTPKIYFRKWKNGVPVGFYTGLEFEEGVPPYGYTYQLFFINADFNCEFGERVLMRDYRIDGSYSIYTQRVDARPPSHPVKFRIGKKD
jgi:hypothetical protein